jgi:hypothetical protein
MWAPALIWAELIWAAFVWAAFVWAAFVWAALIWAAFVWAAFVWAAFVWAALIWGALIWAALIWAALARLVGLDGLGPLAGFVGQARFIGLAGLTRFARAGCGRASGRDGGICDVPVMGFVLGRVAWRPRAGRAEFIVVGRRSVGHGQPADSDRVWERRLPAGLADAGGEHGHDCRRGRRRCHHPS